MGWAKMGHSIEKSRKVGRRKGKMTTDKNGECRNNAGKRLIGRNENGNGEKNEEWAIRGGRG